MWAELKTLLRICYNPLWLSRHVRDHALSFRGRWVHHVCFRGAFADRCPKFPSGHVQVYIFWMQRVAPFPQWSWNWIGRQPPYKQLPSVRPLPSHPFVDSRRFKRRLVEEWGNHATILQRSIKRGPDHPVLQEWAQNKISCALNPDQSNVSKNPCLRRCANSFKKSDPEKNAKFRSI